MLQRRGRFAIFDLDGILLDTEPIYSRATDRVLHQYGQTLSWSVKQRMMGRGELEAAGILVETLHLPLSPEGYLEARRPWLQQWFPDAEPLPGAPAFVAALDGRGVGMAVATSSQSRWLPFKTARHAAWFCRFRATICGDDPRLQRAKPAPDIFLLAASELGAAPADCVVFEDSPAGVAAGKAAGMQVVAIPDANIDRAHFAAADVVVSGYAELTPEMLGIG